MRPQQISTSAHLHVTLHAHLCSDAAKSEDSYVVHAGCQNYGPFLGAPDIGCRIIIGIQKGTIILTTTHVQCTDLVSNYGVCARQPPIIMMVVICRHWQRRDAHKVLRVILGLYWDNGKQNGNYYIVYWGYIGIMEKKKQTTA